MTSKSTTAGSVTAALQAAVSQGLAGAASQVLIQNLDDTTLMGCIGVDFDQLDATEATIVSVAIDRSGSMSPHVQAVVDGFNEMISALQKSKAASNILVNLWFFDTTPSLAYAYTKIEDVQPLTPAGYRPTGGTALYDTVLSALTNLAVYGQQLTDNGVPNRRVLFVLTDGDNNSSRAQALDVRTALAGALRQEMYTLAFAGFGGMDLTYLANEMGFPPGNITNGKNPSDLRRIFGQVSQSISRVSQGIAAPAGGFFAP